MARTLPWLTNKPKVSKEVAARVRPTKRRKVVETESDDEPAPKPRLRPGGHAARVRQARTPSTSPPPEPPQEEYMVDGLEHDDIYVMVEDEFLSVAQSFTQHLHHAEYVRMKNLAKSQNASAIQHISRPTDSRVKMREELKKKKAAQARASKQSATLDALGSKRGKGKLEDIDSELDEDTDNDPWAGTSLQGLMTGSKRSKQSLSVITGIKSGTRAAAGYARARVKSSPERTIQSAMATHIRSNKVPLPSMVEEDLTETEDDDDDDDLDAPVLRARALNQPKSMFDGNVPSRPRQDPPLKRTAEPYSGSEKAKIKSESDSVVLKVENTLPSSNSAHSDLPTPADSQQSPIKDEDDSLFDHIPKPSVLSGNVARRIQQRLAHMKAEKEEQDGKKSKMSSLNEIPAFLNG